VWSWSRALVGAVYAVPAGMVTAADPAHGLPLAVGVLPAAMIPVPARRRDRLVIAVIGFAAGASLFLGGVIAHLPTVLTALLLAGAVVGSAVLATALPAGRVVLALCAPLVAAGLSYDDWATSTQTFLLLTVGALYACLVSMLWPPRDPRPRPGDALPGRRAMTSYGVRLGLAAAVAYLMAAALRLDHPGWAPAACLLVARPQPDLLRSRGIGRVASVTVGAVVAVGVLHLAPADGVYAALTVVVLAATAATAGSRWYITAGFTTFFVMLMLLLGHGDQTLAKVNERVLETVLGFALAYLFTGGLRRSRRSA
jgi:uncharacterized membrane protein YgaE (UPF0421/DUF939 family)